MPRILSLPSGGGKAGRSRGRGRNREVGGWVWHTARDPAGVAGVVRRRDKTPASSRPKRPTCERAENHGLRLKLKKTVPGVHEVPRPASRRRTSRAGGRRGRSMRWDRRRTLRNRPRNPGRETRTNTVG
jgi:hypothetical protein